LLVAFLADLLAANRKMIEDICFRLRMRQQDEGSLERGRCGDE
jgi:hypothetical protein